MRFVLIDRARWERREVFEHYFNNVSCSFALTAQVDVTRLKTETKKRGIKFYPAQIFALASVVNQLQEFRFSLNERGELGYWERLFPVYTVFHPETERFSVLWTPCYDNFREFKECFDADAAMYTKTDKGMFPKPDMPDNVFNVSALPWINFSAFNLMLPDAKRYLLPIFTSGKFEEKGAQTVMPLSVQVHHAVCDGFHVAKFIQKFQDKINSCSDWLE